MKHSKIIRHVLASEVARLAAENAELAIRAAHPSITIRDYSDFELQEEVTRRAIAKAFDIDNPQMTEDGRPIWPIPGVQNCRQDNDGKETFDSIGLRIVADNPQA